MSEPRLSDRLRVLERELLRAEQNALRWVGELGRGGQHAGSPRLREIEEIRRALRNLARETESALCHTSGCRNRPEINPRTGLPFWSCAVCRQSEKEGGQG